MERVVGPEIAKNVPFLDRFEAKSAALAKFIEPSGGGSFNVQK